MRPHLEGISPSLSPADLRNVIFNHETNLQDIILGNKEYGFIHLSDIDWGNTNLAISNWLSINMLGEERKARCSKQLNDYQIAVRANRQLSLALQAQGLNEIATHFAYRAQKLQRVVLRQQKKFGPYLFSLFLDLLAGYGYKPGRSFIAYLLIIFGFMSLYLLNSLSVVA